MTIRFTATNAEKFELNSYFAAIQMTGIETEETVKHAETIEGTNWFGNRAMVESEQHAMDLREALDASSFYSREADANGCTTAEMLEYVAADSI